MEILLTNFLKVDVVPFTEVEIYGDTFFVHKAYPDNIGYHITHLKTGSLVPEAIKVDETITFNNKLFTNISDAIESAINTLDLVFNGNVENFQKFISEKVTNLNNGGTLLWMC